MKRIILALAALVLLSACKPSNNDILNTCEKVGATENYIYFTALNLTKPEAMQLFKSLKPHFEGENFLESCFDFSSRKIGEK